MSFTTQDFDEIHADGADPWSCRTSWYEERKRAMTLAALPYSRYQNAFEPGCSIGELTASLAPRCERLLAWDISTAALATAAGRLASYAHIHLDLGRVPVEWPDETFDLIVISEMGYFLTAPELARLLSRVEAGLGKRGIALLCHWRHPIRRGDVDGHAVHAQFENSRRLKTLVQVIETDFCISVLTAL